MTARLTCALLIAIAACDSAPPPNNVVDPDAMIGSGSDATTIDALTAGQACAAQAASRCTKLATCSPADLSRRFGDLATCETRENLACTDGLAAPDSGATPGGALACGEALAASTCSDFLGRSPPQACQPAPGPGNGTCAFATQCTTAFCAVGANALCGLCQDEPVAGTSCAASGCGETLVCVSATHLCELPGGLNAQCNKTAPCGDGFTCVGATNNNPGTCKAVVTTAGSPCDPTHKNGPGCSGDDGLTCNIATKVCVTQPLVAAGMPCGQINNVDTGCTAGANCVIAANQTVGTCVAPAADGGACDTKVGPDCLTPARCIPTAGGTAGTCRLPGSTSCM